MFEQLVQDSIVAMPFIGWVIVGIAVLGVQIVTRCSKACFGTSIVGLSALLIYSILSLDVSSMQPLFASTVIMDPLSQYLNIVSIAIVLGVCLMSMPGIFHGGKLFKQSFEQYPEFLMCLIFSGFGAVVAVSAVDLTSFFLGIESLSMGLYCLCGFFRSEIRSTESAAKYLFIGAFSTVILLYGISFIYGAAGSTNYAEIQSLIQAGPDPLVLLAIVMTMVGLAFKLALVPFHLYTADVYEGAPTPITAYLATIVKLAAIGAGLRLFWGIFADFSNIWGPAWAALCVLSIIVGNIAALQQRSLKKLLAFSSISHAGFLGLGLYVANPASAGLFPVLTYVTLYSAMTLGIFALVNWIEERESVFQVEDLRGLGLQRPLIGLLFAAFALGLAGIPPLAGFMMKFWILRSLIENGDVSLALFSIVGSVIGLAYYLKILMLLFMSAPEEQGAAVRWSGLSDRFYSIRAVLVVALVLTLIGGLRPQFYADWIFQAIALK